MNLIAGKPVELDQPFTFRFTCCDCALTHLFMIETVDKGDNTYLAVKVYGDDHETDRRRDEMKELPMGEAKPFWWLRGEK